MGKDAVAVARIYTRHIKNRRVVYRTSKRLYGELLHLFPIHSYPTLDYTSYYCPR